MRASIGFLSRIAFRILLPLLVIGLAAPVPVAHAEEGTVRGATCIRYYNTTAGTDSPTCGTSRANACRTAWYAALRVYSCPVATPAAPGAPGAPAPQATPEVPVTIVLPPTPPDPNMPADPWLALLPGFNLFFNPLAYDTTYGPLLRNVTIQPGSLTANFVDPAFFLPLEVIELAPAAP